MLFNGPHYYDFRDGRLMVDRFSSVWTGLAKGGAPHSEITPEWPAYDLDFHPAPRRQYVVNLTGGVELEVGSGEKRTLGPGSILLAEDTTGRGHKSRAVNNEPRQCLFIALE